jgi:hypothetical protein
MTLTVQTRLLLPLAAITALFSALAVPATAAAPIAATTGNLNVDVKTFVSGLNGQVNGGVYVQADGVDGKKADVTTSDPNFKIKAINLIKLDNPLQNVFGYPGWGLVPVPKFPGGNPTCGFIQTQKVGPNTDSFAGSNFCTDIDNTKVKTKYTAQFNPTAEVKATGALPSNGIAVANGSDPWFFESDSPTVLDLTVDLNDVLLQAISDSTTEAIAAIETFGSFGFEDSDGSHVLASWSYSDSVFGNTTTGPYSLNLVNQSFALEPGIVYELDTSITSAAALVPEPSSLILFIPGMFVLGYGRARHRCKAE